MSKKNKEEKEIKEEKEVCKDEAVNEQTEGKAEEGTEEEEKDPLKEAEEKIAELQDKYIRQVAEFENYRKRVTKEKAELILNGGERVLTALLPVIDDLERAKENIDKATDVDALKEGVELIIEKFASYLKAQGVSPIEAVGKDFDTEYHEAIAMLPAPSDDMKGKVIDCVQKGYMLNEKVIRHSKVAVAQ